MSKTTKIESVEGAAAPGKAEETGRGTAVLQAEYSVAELADAHKTQFCCRRELVTAALEHGGKARYTLSEAKQLVNKFRRKRIERRKQ